MRTLPMISKLSEKELREDADARRAKKKILSCIAELKFKLRELLFGLNVFKPVAIHERLPLMTNGKELYYSPFYVLKTERKVIQREILHITLHGLFGHFVEEKNLSDTLLAWAAMDIKVDRMMSFYLGTQHTLTGRDSGMEETGKEPVGLELYYRGKRDPAFREKVMTEGAIVLRDNHWAWRMNSLTVSFSAGEDTNPQEWQDASEAMKEYLRSEFGNSMNGEELENLMEKAANDADRRWGSGSEGGLFEEQEMDGKPADYRSILETLRKMAVTSKEEDIPDTILYTYGLELYEDMPLVEPTEEAEKPALDNIVVAVDTSGSCIRDLPVFLRETRGLLTRLNNECPLKNLRYLECDTTIRREEIILGDEIQDALKAEHQYMGGGGTDFRPVFRRICEWEAKGEKIDCLLYFSDTFGIIPDNAPDYPCYFILSKDEAPRKELPKWAQLLKL